MREVASAIQRADQRYLAHLMARQYHAEFYEQLREDAQNAKKALDCSEQQFALCYSVVRQDIGREPHLQQHNRNVSDSPDIHTLYTMLFTYEAIPSHLKSNHENGDAHLS